jgi:hypothetical protein
VTDWPMERDAASRDRVTTVTGQQCRMIHLN